MISTPGFCKAPNLLRPGRDGDYRRRDVARGGIARLWAAFTEPVIARIAATIDAELRGGAIRPGIDPAATARVLVGMNLRAFFERLAGRPDADVEAVVDDLHPVWDRALYGA